MLVAVAGHDILIGRALLRPKISTRLDSLSDRVYPA